MVDPIFANTQFQNWYPQFRDITPKARVLDAPEEFRKYLLADGIVLHESENESESDSEWETLDAEDKKKIADEARKSSNSGDNGSNRGQPTPSLQPPADFHRKIEAAIEELNGEVAPKLNWSAPTDSTWMSTSNTMKSKNANDVYLLLKSSDYINHDLQLEPERVTLVLREWFNLHPSTEFRCFVRDGKLVAITQRDMNYYDFLEKDKPTIEKLLLDLAAKISARFPDPSFVFDAHIANNKKAWLIDINPWHEQTDSILFSWDELPSLDDLDFRLVDKFDRTRTFSSKPHTTSHVPVEFVNMEQGTLEDMLSQMKEQRKQESLEDRE